MNVKKKKNGAGEWITTYAADEVLITEIELSGPAQVHSNFTEMSALSLIIIIVVEPSGSARDLH